MNPQAKYGANPENRTGGLALPFYDTISFRVSKVRKSEERDEKGKIFAHQAKIKFDKNKAGGLPADPIVIRIRYDGTGIDQEAELMSVAELNDIVREMRKGRFNFVKPGTEDLLDPTIENFKRDEFKETLDKYPKMKETIWNFISQGKFYVSKDIEEDNPDVEESLFVKPEETNETVEETKAESVVEEVKDEQPEQLKRKRKV